MIERIFSVILWFQFALLGSAMAASNTPVPLPLPKDVRVAGAGPLGQVWTTLTRPEQRLAFHLTAAARDSRQLLFFQNHRHGLLIRSFLVLAFAERNQTTTRSILGAEGYREFLIYSAKFLDLAGPYAGSNRKYILNMVKADRLEKLMDVYLSRRIDAKTRQEVVQLLTDPNYEVLQYPEDQNGAGLENTGGNLYEKGIKGEEVLQAIANKTLNPTLNCRVVRTANGLACEILTTNTPGIVGSTLRGVVRQMTLAKIFSKSQHQKNQIDYMVKFFQKGNIDDFRSANIEWVKDRSDSTVDFMNGFVEVYEDWLARIASWESYVQIVDPKVSLIAQGLAKHAQHFEDEMPYGIYKKKFPQDYSPPAIMVYYFDEISSYRSGGYNLPNFDDIRRDVGAKNVIKLANPGENADPNFVALYKEVFNEFLPANKVDDVLKNRVNIWQNLVLLHEIIGHGSGTYDETKYPAGADPISVLGPLGSALEEQRADLTALTYVADSALIEVGIYKDAAEAEATKRLMYDFYLGDFLRRTSSQRTFTEAHQRGHWLFISKLLEQGAIGWAAKDESKNITDKNQVLVVLDYDKYHKVSEELLGELQRIKAVRDEEALKDIFAKYAPLDAITQSWAQAVIDRGKDLKINSGYVEQPWQVLRNGGYVTYGGDTLESIAKYWRIFY